jgi:CrcB protein
MANYYLGQILLVGLGGFVGSSLRFMLGDWVNRSTSLSAFPWGTLAVNVLGCLLIGVLGGLAESRQVLEPWQRLFLMVGVLGGFTTFSTFAFETVSLAQDSAMLKAVLNTAAQVVLGFSAAVAGYLVARWV